MEAKPTLPGGGAAPYPPEEPLAAPLVGSTDGRAGGAWGIGGADVCGEAWPAVVGDWGRARSPSIAGSIEALSPMSSRWRRASRSCRRVTPVGVPSLGGSSATSHSLDRRYLHSRIRW